MRITMLFDLFGDHLDFLPVLFFLFNGLRRQGHTLDILPPEDFHRVSSDLLLMERGEGEALYRDGHEGIGLLEKRGLEYTLSLPVLERRYSFSPGPYLELFRVLEEDKDQPGSLMVLILWLTGEERALYEVLQGMEMMARSLPKLSIHLITRRENPGFKTPLPLHVQQLFHIAPEDLVKEYNRSSLCLGLVPHFFFLQEVLACNTPVISIGEDHHPQIPHILADARDIAVVSLKILKIGQLANRLAREGRSLVQEDDASLHLSHIQELLIEYEEGVFFPRGEDGERYGDYVLEDELEEGLFQTSFVLKKMFFQLLDFFSGKRRDP